MIQNFWDVILCRLAISTRRVRGSYCLHLQGQAVQRSTLQKYHHHSQSVEVLEILLQLDKNIRKIYMKTPVQHIVAGNIKSP